MTKSKPWRRFLPILLAVLLALGIALYAVPYAQMVSYRNSAPVQTCAAQLAAAYGEKPGPPSPKRIFAGTYPIYSAGSCFPTPSPRKS